MKQLEPPFLLIEMQNVTTTLQNSLVVSYNFKHMLTTQPGNPTSRYLSQGNENKCHRKPVFESLWWLYLQSPKIENDTNTIWPVNAKSKWDKATRWAAIQNGNKCWMNGSIRWDSQSLCEVCLDKAIIQRDTHPSIFLLALFTTAKTWKQPEKCPSTGERIKKI